MMRREIAVAAVLLAVVVVAVWSVRTQDDALSIEPRELDFGPVAVGEQRRLSLVATNLGREPIELARVAIDAPFGLTPSKLKIEPGQAHGLVVTYAPTEPGRSDGSVTLASDAHRVSIAVKGSALDPASISVDPLRIAFGDVAVSGEAKGAFTITNSGGSPLQIDALASGLPFRADVASLVVEPGESRTVEVAFRPTVAGRFDQSLAIRSNDPTKPTVAVELAGKGVATAPAAAIDVAPGALEFGSVSTCASERRWVSIRNVGADPLAITATQIAAPFSTSTRSRMIAAGGALDLPVVFAPSGEGAQSAPLAIYSNDPARGIVRVDLAGTAVACAPGEETRSARNDAGGGSSSSRDGARGIFAGFQPTAGAATPGEMPGSAPAPGDGNGSEPAPGDGNGNEPSPGGVGGAAVLGGSKVRISSYSAAISSFHVDGVGFDPGSGNLTLEGVRLPVVEAALGEFFMFSPTSGSGQVDALGETQIQLPIEFLDPDGSATPLSITLTTGTSSVVVNDQQVSITGSPLDASGKAKLVGMTVLPSRTGFGGEPMRIELNVQVK